MKSRWGSCGRSGRITLNVELIKLDPKYTDYVILHELCHLKEMNHGKGFYELLGRCVPTIGHFERNLGNTGCGDQIMYSCIGSGISIFESRLLSSSA